MTAPRPTANSCAIVLTGLIAFSVTIVVAACLYPGGSWADPTAPGFRPFVNYWCDLMRTVSANGEPNGPSFTLTRIAFWVFAGTSLLFWPLASKPCAPPWVAKGVIVCGRISALCVVLIALLPYDTNQTSHAAVTLGAGGSGFAAMALAMLGSLRSGPLLCWRNGWAAATVVAASLNLVIYTRIILTEATESPALPAIQKFATLFLILWMVATTLRVWRSGRTKPARVRYGDEATTAL